MNAQIDEMINAAGRQAQEARSLVHDHSDVFTRRPEEHRWSAAEHIAHISLTDRPYLDVIEPAILKAREGGKLGEGPFRGGTVGNWFANSMKPPVKRRMKTMKRLHPPAELDVDAVLHEFETTRADLVRTLEGARGVDLDRAKMRSPFLKILKMPVYSGYRVLLIHADRHLWLVREAIDAVENPAVEDPGVSE